MSKQQMMEPRRPGGRRLGADQFLDVPKPMVARIAATRSTEVAIVGSDHRGVAGVRHPVRVTSDNAPALGPSFPFVDIFAVGIEHGTCGIAYALMAGLNIGAA